MDAQRLARLEERFQAATWGRATDPDASRATPDLEAVLPAGWTVLDRLGEEAEEGPESETLLSRSAEPDREEVLRVDLYRYPDPQAAREGLLLLLDNFQGPPPERLEGAAAIGDAAFATPGAAVTLFLSGTTVVRVSSAGADLVETGEAARSLAEVLGGGGGTARP